MGLEPTTSWTTTRGYHQLSYGHRVPSGYRYRQMAALFARFKAGAQGMSGA